MKIIKSKPDIFVYGEAQIPSPINLSLKGYTYYVHRSKPNAVDNFRRGLAIFYLNKHKFRLTKVFGSSKFDIVWMRMENSNEVTHFCFFYSPGSHHPISVRTKFYNIFCSKFTKFASLGRVYLLGDTNARLGSLLKDKDIHGKFITNQNSHLLLNFLEFSGLTILNKVFCSGVPTYEIVNKKRSIIDLCLTNSLESVKNFIVDPTPLGANSQTCHKPLILDISLRPHPQSPETKTIKKRIVFSSSPERQIKMAKFTASRLSTLYNNGTSPD